MIKKFVFNLTKITDHYDISVKELSVPTPRTQIIVGDLLQNVLEDEDAFEDSTNVYTIMDIFDNDDKILLYVTDTEQELNLIHKKIFKTEEKPDMTKIEGHKEKHMLYVDQPVTSNKVREDVVSLLKVFGLSDMDIAEYIKDLETKKQRNRQVLVTEDVSFMFDTLEASLDFIDSFAGFNDRIHLGKLYNLHGMYFITGSLTGTNNSIASLAAYLSDYCTVCMPMSFEHGKQILENVDNIVERES